MELEELKIIEEIEHIEELSVINKIHTRNFEILDKHLAKFPDLKSSLPGDLISIAYDAKIEKWEYMDFLQNYVFNYLSSAKSLIDLTRKHYKNYYEQNLSIKEYQKKVKENFIESGLHSFIQQFRNYVIHFGTPPLSPSKFIDYMDNHKVTHRVIISKDILIKSGFDWNELSKEFLNSGSWKEYQDINVLFSEYYSSLKSFQDWYYSEQRSLYIEQFEKIELSNVQFQEKIISSIVNRMESGKGFTISAIETRLLRCFNMIDAKEIIEINDQKKRIAEMVNRLRNEKVIDNKTYGTLIILSIM